MRRLLQLLVVACAATGVAVGGGMLVTLGADDVRGGAEAGSSPGAVVPTTPAVPAPVALGDLDTLHLAVQRAAFCDVVPEQAVTDALGTAPTTSGGYVNGQRDAITRRVTDVAHEYECHYATGPRARPVTARAWVFAPPVTPSEARVLVRRQVRATSCDPLRGVPVFGSPTAATVCRTQQGLQVSYRGLFGDAWLACTLTGASPDRAVLDRRAQTWCAAVATAAAGA